MHEYSIVQALVDSVEAVARPHAGANVHHLYVQIGDLAGVDCDLLQTAYDTFRFGTICADAPMTIERVPARWECPQCHAPFAPGTVLRCSVCSEPARLAAGDEILLRRVEMEVA
jgi:hydrogenase nickel incorporation protein HypA/HybF